MHFHWKKILQTSKNARRRSTWNSSIRIWALSPPWPWFDSRHGNSTSEIFRRTNCRILSKALEPTFQISVVDKFWSPPNHYNDYYLVFLFHFDNSLIYRPRHNTSVDTAITFFWLINEQVGRINNKNHWKLLVLFNIFTFYKLKHLHKGEIKLKST